jgi:hypothetical protein
VSIEEKVFTRKTFTVRAVRVTSLNMREVTLWCGGRYVIPTAFGRRPYVEVPFGTDPTRQKKMIRAYHGDWVTCLLKTNAYRVYNEQSFRAAFDEVLDNHGKFQAVLDLIEEGIGPQSRLDPFYENADLADLARKIMDIFT